MKSISEDKIMEIKESLIELQIKIDHESTDLSISRNGIPESLKAVKGLFESSLEDVEDINLILNLANKAREAVGEQLKTFNRSRAVEIRNLLDAMIHRLKRVL